MFRFSQPFFERHLAYKISPTTMNTYHKIIKSYNNKQNDEKTTQNVCVHIPWMTSERAPLENDCAGNNNNYYFMVMRFSHLPLTFGFGGKKENHKSTPFAVTHYMWVECVLCSVCVCVFVIQTKRWSERPQARALTFPSPSPVLQNNNTQYIITIAINVIWI